MTVFTTGFDGVDSGTRRLLRKRKRQQSTSFDGERRPKSRCRAILFDAGNTLIFPRVEDLAAQLAGAWPLSALHAIRRAAAIRGERGEYMKNVSIPLIMVGLFGLASASFGQPDSQYVKLCTIFGAGFDYIPGMDVCLNQQNGAARRTTPAGIWTSVLPYKDGEWVTNLQQACEPGGRLVKLGTFKSSDFTLNPYLMLETSGVPLNLTPPEFITKFIMSGGFYDPRLPAARSGNGLGTLALCVRSIDPNVIEQLPGGAFHPPYSNGGVPLACVVNSRIVGMPAAYAVSAMGAYPEIDTSFVDYTQTIIGGPYTYGSELVITTDILAPGALALSYSIPGISIAKPLAGALSVSACVARGNQGQGN